jgi:hypothetical protein
VTRVDLAHAESHLIMVWGPQTRQAAWRYKKLHGYAAYRYRLEEGEEGARSTAYLLELQLVPSARGQKVRVRVRAYRVRASQGVSPIPYP